MKELGNVVFIEGEPIQIDSEDAQRVFGYYFGFQIAVSKTNKGNYYGELILDDSASDARIINAVRAWNHQFKHKTFVDTLGIVITVMDCLLEQKMIEDDKEASQ